MIEIQPVTVDAAIAHQTAVTNATHLLSCADYLIQALPEDVGVWGAMEQKISLSP